LLTGYPSFFIAFALGICHCIDETETETQSGTLEW
jgi:hypothetical protein